jgi:hypothetical protein
MILDAEWDDSCPGLIETMAQEVEWKAREVSNNAVQWGKSLAKGWEVTRPVSPVEEAVRF